MTEGSPPERIQAWLMAIRPATLSAAVAPVVLGTAMAASRRTLSLGPAAAALLAGVLIQIATNLANDYFDHRKGSDSDDRAGPTRVVQSGLIEPRRVLQAAGLALGVATVIGGYLVWVGGWPILAIGIASLLCAFGYTAGPFPLAYHGLGDLFVFVFFGLVAVGGTYWVQALEIAPDILVAGAGLGAMTTAILVVNNLRDIDTDARAGKRTLAVLLGRRWTRVEFLFLILAAALVPPWGVLRYAWSAWTLLALFGLGPGLRALNTVFTYKDPRELNAALVETARSVTWYGGLLAVGFVLGAQLS